MTTGPSPKFYGTRDILQHRLYGYSGSARADSDLIPVVAFVGLPRSEQVKLFMQINENQQAVPKNLRNTLNADLLWDSENMRERVRALKLRIAQYLGEDKRSPLVGRVLIGENPRSAIRCIAIESINIGLDRSNFIGNFSKSQMQVAGTFYRGTNEATFDALTPFLDRCFGYLKTALPTQWELGNADGGFVFINNGVESLIRIFSDVVDHLAKDDILPSALSLDEFMGHVDAYLDVLADFLSTRNVEDAFEFRRLYGSAGRASYWRRLQAVINDADPHFEPDGFMEYMTEQEKRFNLESFAMIRELEQFLKDDVRHKLEDRFGSSWFKRGVPLKIQQEATKLQIEKNQERDDEDEVDVWDCLHLVNYVEIMGQKHELWIELFAKQYTRPGYEKKSWRSALDWLKELNRIRNENDHSYIVKEPEYDFLVILTTWLIKGQMDNEL